MIKNKIKTYIGLSCLSLSLFASCAKETEPFEGKTGNTSTNNDKAQEDKAAGESIAISLSGDMLEDELRAMNFTLADRGGKYTNEFKPMLRGGSSVQYVFLALVKEGDPNSLFLQTVLFNREKKSDGSLDPHKIFYRGEVQLPAGYSLGDGNWYAMGLVNYDYAEQNNVTKTSLARYGNSNNKPSNTTDNDNRINLASSVLFGGTVGANFSIYSPPFISQWKKLKVLESAVEGSTTGEKLYTAEVSGLRFKPQGVLIQYDFGDNIQGQKDIRRHAIVSNTLAFSGKYDLSATSLYKKFEARDPNTGIGMPEWQEDPANMSGYKLYRYKGANPLAIGDQVYPWDVPAASDALTETMGLAPSLIEEIATDGDAHATIRSPYYKDNTQLWRFAPSDAALRKVGFIWGMPRKTSPQKPYTYFLASSYDMLQPEDNFTNPIEPEALEVIIIKYDNYHFAKDQVAEIAKKIQGYETKIQSYEQTPTTETDQAKTERLRKLKETRLLLASAKVNEQLLKELLAQRTQELGGYDQAKEQKARDEIKTYYEQLRKKAIQQVTPRTQPLVVLYQTNTNFTNEKNGKVVHAQSVLTSDLMFSELIYKQTNDGKVYTIAEIHNPTADYVDLRQYAIARLIPNTSGTHLSYRRANGTATDNLAEALIMPLSVVDPEVTDPFASGTYMNSWVGDKGVYDRRDKNIEGAYTADRYYPKYDRWNRLHEESKEVPYNGMLREQYLNKTKFDQRLLKDGELIPLGQSQTILLGGGNFLDKVDLQKWTNGIDWTKLGSELSYPEKTARWAIAYNDGIRKPDGTLGEGTLDFRPGEGLVLLKKQPGDGGWQVIDATAPIGANGLGYSGTYATFKTLFQDKTEFSFRRVDHVHFPCIFPFRTKSTRTDGQADDWVTADLNLSSNTMGYRNSDKSNRGWDKTMNWSWKRTPLDFNYTTYRTNIPK